MGGRAYQSVLGGGEDVRDRPVVQRQHPNEVWSQAQRGEEDWRHPIPRQSPLHGAVALVHDDLTNTQPPDELRRQVVAQAELTRSGIPLPLVLRWPPHMDKWLQVFGLWVHYRQRDALTAQHAACRLCQAP